MIAGDVLPMDGSVFSDLFLASHISVDVGIELVKWVGLLRVVPCEEEMPVFVLIFSDFFELIHVFEFVFYLIYVILGENVHNL